METPPLYLYNPLLSRGVTGVVAVVVISSSCHLLLGEGLIKKSSEKNTWHAPVNNNTKPRNIEKTNMNVVIKYFCVSQLQKRGGGGVS